MNQLTINANVETIAEAKELLSELEALNGKYEISVNVSIFPMTIVSNEQF